MGSQPADRPDEADLKNGADPGRGLASQPAASKSAEFQFERPDWVLFRSADTLAQKAGVRKHLLRRIVLLREAKIGAQVADALAMIEMPDPDTLAEAVTGWIKDHEDGAWSSGVAELANDLAEAADL